MEPRITPDNQFGGWCIGDGGVTIALSDGTNDFISDFDSKMNKQAAATIIYVPNYSHKILSKFQGAPISV